MSAEITEWSSAMMTSLAAAMAMFFSAIPKILGFAVIVVVGWLLASLVEKGVRALLRAVKFNDLAARSGLADFVSKMGADTDSAGIIGLAAKWFIRLIALVVAFDALGLPAVSEVLRDLLLWLPNVVVALVVLVIGGLAARALSNLVRGATAEAGLGNSNLLAKVASALVWAFAIVVAVNQIGIATELVNTLFMAFVGAIALGLGLAFGLGGRETAGEILRNWYRTVQERKGQIAEAVEAGSAMAAGSAGATSDRGGTGGASGGGLGGPGGAGYGGGAGGGGTAGGGGYGGTPAGALSPGGSYSGGPQYPTDGGPRTGPAGSGSGAGTPQDGNSQMYPTPSAARPPSDGGF